MLKQTRTRQVEAGTQEKTPTPPDVEFVLPAYNEEEEIGLAVTLLSQWLRRNVSFTWKVTVADNANCCYTDFELVTRDGSYPEEQSWVIVEGVLGYYQLDGENFPHIDVYKVEPWN